MITLKSSDGAIKSRTIKHMIEDDCAENGIPIPIPNVNSKIFAKVIEYIKKHVELAHKGADEIADKANNDELKTWDAEFVKVDQATLFDLILCRCQLPKAPVTVCTPARHVSKENSKAPVTVCTPARHVSKEN